MSNISRHSLNVKFSIPFIFFLCLLNAYAADDSPSRATSETIATAGSVSSALPLVAEGNVTGGNATPRPTPKPAQQGPQLWLTTGFVSHHFKRDAGYNERNTGLGAEMQFNDDTAIAAGIYRNSVRNSSHYLQYVWTPLSLGPLHIGASVGAIDGYPELRNGKIALSLMPVASMNFKVFNHDAGLNFVYIPTIASRVSGALALQLKFRLH
ncbi:MAG TPA: hypothetical protein VGO51_18410 [Burkholderiaceae bacterium]|nr:hypothetical protein [Burkholderiaceae bacterium]